eukprot:753368-Prorocentrum_minimum.AAC.1
MSVVGALWERRRTNAAPGLEGVQRGGSGGGTQRQAARVCKSVQECAKGCKRVQKCADAVHPTHREAEGPQLVERVPHASELLPGSLWLWEGTPLDERHVQSSQSIPAYVHQTLPGLRLECASFAFNRRAGT